MQSLRAVPHPTDFSQASAQALLPRLHTLVRTSYEAGKRMLFKRVGGDMRISEGEWRLEPITNARATRLHYNALVAPSFPVPEFMVEHAVHEDLPNMLRSIQRASLADAKSGVSVETQSMSARK